MEPPRDSQTVAMRVHLMVEKMVYQKVHLKVAAKDIARAVLTVSQMDYLKAS